MNISDLVDVTFWGILAGGFAFLVLDHNLKQPLRTKAIKWCLATGGCAFLYFALFALLNEKPFPSKTTLALGFVGPSALVCGILLAARDYFYRWKEQNDA